MNEKKPKWPVAWTKQQHLDRKPNLLIYSEMLPGCIGFIATNGETVLYGSDYKNKQQEGRIQ